MIKNIFLFLLFSLFIVGCAQQNNTVYADVVSEQEGIGDFSLYRNNLEDTNKGILTFVGSFSYAPEGDTLYPVDAERIKVLEDSDFFMTQVFTSASDAITGVYKKKQVDNTDSGIELVHVVYYKDKNILEDEMKRVDQKDTFSTPYYNKELVGGYYVKRLEQNEGDLNIVLWSSKNYLIQIVGQSTNVSEKLVETYLTMYGSDEALAIEGE